MTDSPGAEIRAARRAAALTQLELARRCAISQPKLSAYERGSLRPSDETLQRILQAARPRPSEMLERHAESIRAIARSHHLDHVRVFGSSVYGTDTIASDIDLLVHATDEASLLDLAGFEAEVSALTDYPVDVVVDSSPVNRVIERIIAESVPL
ncbi:helix-turn-helix domain-containing protein [Galbitalea sp. SE-J8]|uniref:nucleotidyltransferase domain-containing protein n=1 Tax=Galbitalea sp. SE-J8 TaxID=3054952 RepID=UPI00259CD2C4|nr:XRE family transcriptional regulator [Galbitalea sp. SE-J8]MDM4764319.1 helix-turn-helix domain-containing protein [Galbitalea sp. SE-J8]